MNDYPAPTLQEAEKDALGLIESQVWHELTACACDRGHAWRTAALATVDEQGLADVRTVVIREVDTAARELVFFTDARSPKIAQFECAPRGSLLMWSPTLGWQLRLRVLLEVETSGLAVSSRWARLKMKPAAYDYLSPLPPGSTLDSPHPPPERGTREHFAVVTMRVDSVDWLDLRREGQRRALFTLDQPPRWLQP
jgi:pyridoxamine 5'-phosphate oxidase